MYTPVLGYKYLPEGFILMINYSVAFMLICYKSKSRMETIKINFSFT